MPGIAPHFHPKNKKVSGSGRSTFLPRKSDNLGKHFTRAPLSRKRGCIRGGLNPLYGTPSKKVSLPSEGRKKNKIGAIGEPTTPTLSRRGKTLREVFPRRKRSPSAPPPWCRYLISQPVERSLSYQFLQGTYRQPGL